MVFPSPKGLVPDGHSQLLGDRSGGVTALPRAGASRLPFYLPTFAALLSPFWEAKGDWCPSRSSKPVRRVTPGGRVRFPSASATPRRRRTRLTRAISPAHRWRGSRPGSIPVRLRSLLQRRRTRLIRGIHPPHRGLPEEVGDRSRILKPWAREGWCRSFWPSFSGRRFSLSRLRRRRGRWTRSVARGPRLSTPSTSPIRTPRPTTG